MFQPSQNCIDFCPLRMAALIVAIIIMAAVTIFVACCFISTIGFIGLNLFHCFEFCVKCVTCKDEASTSTENHWTSTPKIDIIHSHPGNSMTPLQPSHAAKKTSAANQQEDCIICYESPTSKGRLGPCGHSSFCFNCCIQLAKQPNARCPLCRTLITQVKQENAPAPIDTISLL